MSEWIKYEKTWEQFCKDDLNKPGTQVDVENKLLLIGDVDKLGGGNSGYCPAIKEYETVTRYRVLMSEES